jgi:hypothetical protein
MPYAPGPELPPPVLQTPDPGATYPYDGGPKVPVPTPKGPEPAPISAPKAPKATVPLEGRTVALPKQPTKWAYPAYGEQPRQTSFASDRTTVVIKSNTVPKP